jgi:hypothetical protein
MDSQMKPSFPSLRSAVAVAGLALSSLLAADKAVFEQDFTQVPPGELPAEFMVLDGQFTVKEEAGNRFIELPGAPLDSFGVLFGNNAADGLELTARIHGTRSGRKFPTFAIGLNGVGGYKVRVSPAKGVVELVHGDDIKASAPFKWISGEWTRLKLAVKRQGEGVRITAKAWQGDTEPADWALTADEAVKLPAGKAGVWGLPFSGTPLRFDDLRIAAVP